MLKDQRKTFWISLGLITIACFSTWLMVKNHHASFSSPATLERKPDAYMYQATYFQFNKNGLLHSRLEAEKSTHFPYQNSAIFTKPDFLIYSKDRLPWYITSIDGYSKDGINFIHLSNRVKLYQPPSSRHPSITIKTPNVDVYPEKSIAKTKSHVTIIRPGTKITATGMNADFKNNVVKLLSHAQGAYEETIANPNAKDDN